ncbi:MAG: DUF1634 domain-containing protein [Terriglobia bacterium]
MPIKDEQLDRGMARLLQAGVLISAATMLAGGTLYLLRHGSEVPDYRHFHGVLPTLKQVGGVWSGVLAGRARETIQLGVLLIIATPVMRVAFAVVAFAFERDWLYTAISGVVLSLLLYALCVQ